MKLTTLTGFFKTCFNSNLRIQKTQKPLNNKFSLFIGFFFILLTVFSPMVMSQNIQGVAPVLFPPGGLAIDGNAYVKFPGDPNTPNPPFPSGDWLFERGAPNNDVIPGGVFPFTVSDPVSEGFPEGELSDDFYVYPDLTTFFRDNITNNDPTIFTSRNKINDNPNTYTWGSGSSPNKNEIQNAVAHFSFADPNLPHGNEGDLWMMFFADRQVVKGSSYIDFEVLQNSLTITGTTSGGFISAAPPGAGGRTPGDILVTIEFTNGGIFANVVTRRWTLVNGTYSYQIFTPDPGTIFGTNNTAQTIVPYQIYNQDPLESGEFEGFWQYSLNQWAEGAVNLTAFFDQDPCFSISTLFIRTRTSGSSGQSELKDFPGKPLQLTLDLTPSVEIAKSDVTCNGESDGVVSIVEASGYDRLDLFKVVGNQDGVGNNEMDDTPEGSNTDGSDFKGLSPGSYYVVAVRKNGEVECPAISNVVIITEPDALNLILTPTNASCFGDVKSISAAITGTPLIDLEINIDGGDFQNVVASPVVFNNLTAAEHTIILRRKSNNDCSEERKVTLTEPDELDLELSATNAACFGEAKSISAAITGTPLSDLEINIDGGAFADVVASPVVFNNLTAEEHTVILRRKSDNACLVSEDLTLSEPDELDLVLTPTDATCFGVSNGSISAAITGTPLSDLEINIDGGAFANVVASPVVFDNLSAAEHTIILRRKSNNDCSEERKVTLAEPDELGLILTPTDATCEDNNKSISAAITGTPLSDIEININGGTFATVLASPVVFDGLTVGSHTVIIRRISDNDCSASESATVNDPTNCLAEGCTLGYWKEHTDRWCSSYTTCMLYEDVFTSAPNQFKNADLTLLQALNLGGGGIFNLARQSVAALLNICHDDVAYNYPGGEVQLIIDVNNAYLGIGAFDAGAKATQLDGLNNAGCPLGGSSATEAPSPSCLNGASAAFISSDSNLFTAYPVPFKDALNVQYDFDYTSSANIQIFDLQGRLLRSYTEANAHKGKVTQLSIDFRTNANQVYILKVTTDRDVFTKKIISDK